MSRVIKKSNITVVINPASLGNAKLRSILGVGREYGSRSQSFADRCNLYREHNQYTIIMKTDEHKICKIDDIQFKTDDYKEYSNGFFGLCRKDEERAEQIFKALTPSEFVHLFAFVRDSVNYDRISGSCYGYHNGNFDLLRNRNLEDFLKFSLMVESKHFSELKSWSKHYVPNSTSMNGFTRLYVKPVGFDREFAIGQKVVQCYKNRDKFLSWFGGGFPRYKETPIKKTWIESIRKYKYISTDQETTKCPQCHIDFIGDLIHINDEGFTNYFVVYGGQLSCCKRCYHDNMNSATSNSIRNYSHKPRPLFHEWKNGKIVKSNVESNTLFFGLEIEVQLRAESKKTCKEIAYHINKDSNGFLYCKYDSSVDNGFEIVSHPVTFNAFKNMDLQKYFLKHRSDVKAYYTRSCGMHVHMNRTAFNDLTLWKFALMINEYSKLTKTISQRRNESEYDSWANFKMSQSNDIKADAVQKYKRIKDKQLTENRKYKAISRVGDRYQVVNLRNEKTIEVRSFKANMDETSFRKNVEFLNSLFWFCKDSTPNQLSVENFLNFVKSNVKDYDNLNRFLNRSDTQAKLLS